MTGEQWGLAVIAFIAVAPLAMVIVVAMVRGYTIDVHLERKEK